MKPPPPPSEYTEDEKLTSQGAINIDCYNKMEDIYFFFTLNTDCSSARLSHIWPVINRSLSSVMGLTSPTTDPSKVAFSLIIYHKYIYLWRIFSLLRTWVNIFPFLSFINMHFFLFAYWKNSPPPTKFSGWPWLPDIVECSISVSMIWRI